MRSRFSTASARATRSPSPAITPSRTTPPWPPNSQVFILLHAPLAFVDRTLRHIPPHHDDYRVLAHRRSLISRRYATAGGPAATAPLPGAGGVNRLLGRPVRVT